MSISAGRQTPARTDSTAFRWLYPFDYPILAYLLITLYAAQELSLHINWQILVNFSVELVLLLLGVLPLVTVWYARLLIVDGLRLPAMWKRAVDFVRTTLWNWRRWYEIFRTIIAFKLCMLCYSHIKQSIPLINPVIYDTELDRLDQVIHLGLVPTEMAGMFADIPAVGFFFDKTYFLWYTVKVPFLLFFLLHPSSQRRWHFFTSYFLLWMIGGATAVLIPSLGPVFCEPESYVGVNMPLARELQSHLWSNYTALLENPARYRFVIYEGIAAFPSLHVGIAVLHAIAIRRSPVGFKVFAAYALIIQAGSVVLGWHYAIDGYACGLLAVVIYKALEPRFREVASTGEGCAADD